MFACKKSETLKLSETKNLDSRFTIENNYVRFKDTSSLKSVMAELSKVKTSELANWETKHNISNSLRAFEKDTTNTVEPGNMLVTDLRFASVINKDGLFAIGDSMHLITQDKEYVYKIGTKIAQSNLKSTSVNVRVFNIVKQNISGSSLKSMADVYHWFTKSGFYQPASGHGNDKYSRRVRCYVWSTSYLFYCSNGIGIYCQYNSSGTGHWDDSYMQYVSLNGCTSYSINGSAGQTCGADSDTNEDNEQCTIAWGVGIIHTNWITGYFWFTMAGDWPQLYTDGYWY